MEKGEAGPAGNWRGPSGQLFLWGNGVAGLDVAEETAKVEAA